MSSSAAFLNPTQAARRLGVSSKALRLYEQRGLLLPTRSEAGWRAYGPEAMAQASEIVALRQLGLSLAQVGRVLGGEPDDLAMALAAHQATLEGQSRQVGEALVRVRALRADLAAGKVPGAHALVALLAEGRSPAVGFALPWPWGGEWFELGVLQPLSFIVGPLGSGKTRLAMRLAEELPDAVFSGLDRIDQVVDDPDDGVRGVLDRLLADGANPSPALHAVARMLAGSERQVTVVDLIENGLDAASQRAVGDFLRQRSPQLPPILVMTRSTAVLDLASVGPATALLLCLANHNPPLLVPPYPGTQGYETLAGCLASPEVRARSAGVVVTLPSAAVG